MARDEEQMMKFQQTISGLSDSDVNARFEQMLVSNVDFISITVNAVKTRRPYNHAQSINQLMLNDVSVNHKLASNVSVCI